MNTTIITDVEGFRRIQEDWERLERIDPNTSYYSTFQFNYSWWETFGRDGRRELFIICCYVDNKLVGIAPLMIRRSGSRLLECDTLCFIGKGDYFTFLVDPDSGSKLTIMKSIFRTIDEHAVKWDKVELTHLAQDTQLLYYLLRHDQYNAHVKYLTACPVIQMLEYGTFDQFTTSSEYRKLKKTRDKFRKEVGYTFRAIVGEANEEVYERVSRVHRQQQQFMQTQKGRTERQSLFENKQNEDFLKQMFSRNKEVIVFLLEDDEGEIIIYSINYLHNGTLYDWNAGYSPKYSHFHSLSNVLMLETIQYVFEQKLGDQIDFGAGSYAWKFKWTRHFKVNYSFKMWNMSKHRVKFYRLFSKVRGLWASVIYGASGLPISSNQIMEAQEIIF